ncbi:unnamed protein product [Lepeophtheirus salmonis]|uniref:(salmon louse) hypothetical protein n=1 Tax=Lepeophtheirus salmonis TaxID=72036 RepID=A0A7R8CJR9_LEPSM|nr:unnamed protein product [Lepeophtheirus salmonis]CAF2842287.1 unnamed protein product [Lepeophtheirus salmonis]
MDRRAFVAQEILIEGFSGSYDEGLKEDKSVLEKFQIQLGDLENKFVCLEKYHCGLEDIKKRNSIVRQIGSLVGRLERNKQTEECELEIDHGKKIKFFESSVKKAESVKKRSCISKSFGPLYEGGQL